MRELSADEKTVIDCLVLAWNAFLKLPVEHDDDVAEFRSSIHRLQEKVLCRPARWKPAMTRESAEASIIVTLLKRTGSVLPQEALSAGHGAAYKALLDKYLPQYLAAAHGRDEA
jgi:hypothetical protein